MPQLHGLPTSVQLTLLSNPDIEYVNKFGFNADVDASAADEDIWGGGGLYTGFPTGSAEAAQVFSSDANDTGAGSGLRTLLLTGLDASYVAQTELVTLNGTTPVTTARTWTRINRCPGQSAGSGGTNAGTITVRHATTTANVFAQIPVGTSQTQICAFTIPAGYQGAVHGFDMTASNNSAPATVVRVQVALMSRVFGSGCWRRSRSLWVTTGSGVSATSFEGAVIFPEKTDLVMRALSGASADNLSITASMDIYLVRN